MNWVSIDLVRSCKYLNSKNVTGKSLIEWVKEKVSIVIDRAWPIADLSSSYLIGWFREQVCQSISD